MQLEGLQTLSDTAPARLSAVQRWAPRASQPVRAAELHHAMGHDLAAGPATDTYAAAEPSRVAGGRTLAGWHQAVVGPGERR